MFCDKNISHTQWTVASPVLHFPCPKVLQFCLYACGTIDPVFFYTKRIYEHPLLSSFFGNCGSGFLCSTKEEKKRSGTISVLNSI